MPVISFDIEYTYELQVQTSNINYNGLDTIVSFNDNAILGEYENGVLIATYKGNTNIVNFLKSKNASVLGHIGWEVGNINIKNNETFFKKDETITLAYSFFVNEIIGGTSIRSQKLIEQKINVSYYVPSVSQSISSSDNPLHLFAVQRELLDTDFDIKIEYHSNSNGYHTVVEVPFIISNYSKKFFNKDDTELTTSPYRNSITVNAYYGGDYTYTYYFNVYFEKEATITGARFVGENTTRYFNGKENVFRLPTYQVELSFSDGSSYTQDVASLNVSFRRYGVFGYTQLIPNETMVYEDIEVVCLIEGVRYENLTYRITFENVNIETAELTNVVSIVYGACLKDYENNWRLKLTYADGTIKENVKFKFNSYLSNLTILPSSRNLFSDVNVLVEDVETTISIPTNKFVVPTYIGFHYLTDKTAIKEYSKLDLQYADLYYGVFGYVSNGNMVWTKYYTKKMSLKNEDYTLTSDDFSQPELKGEIKVFNNTGSVTITAKDVFDTTINRSKTITINVINFEDIDTWNIVPKKINYKIEERFLEDDDTQIIFSYGNTTGSEKLSSLVEQGLFTTFPLANYSFKRVEENKEIKVKATFGDNEEKSYSISVEQEGVSPTTKQIKIVAKKVSTLVIDKYMENGEEEDETINDVWALVDKDFDMTDKERISFEDEGVYGYLENVNLDKNKNSRVVMFENIKNPLNSSSNMIVKFPCYVEGNTDKINKSTFGIMFGADNYNNRLFVSGNSDYQNRDWHTADITGAFNEKYDNESENNLTYFPDVNEQQYGSSDTKVVGYDIVSDSKMLVLKEKSNKETTVYFRTPTYNEDDSGNINEVFTVSKGNNSVAGINPHLIINFNGDTLFIDSDNTLQGLDLVGIQGDTQRYANSRSKLIDNKLKDYDLSNSILWTNQKYLYLTVDGLGTFITHYETKGDSQYEWWLVDYDSPQAFIEIGGITYYGNNKGEFFKINKNSFVDVHKVFINKGEGIYVTEINPDDNAEEIVLSERIIEKVKEGDKFKHYVSSDYKNNIFRKVGSIGTLLGFDLQINDGEIFVRGNLLNNGKVIEGYLPRENVDYYLNMRSDQTGSVALDWAGHENDFGIPFRFKYVDTNKVELYQNGVKQNVSQLRIADLCVLIDNDSEIALVDRENNLIKLEKNVDIVKYGKQDLNIPMLTGEISHIDNVKAYYITSPLLANIQYTKTLWDFTLTNDSGLPSELQLGIAKNKMPKKPNQFVSYSATDFDYDEVDYNTLTFESIEIPRVFTRHKVMPKLKFVCFALMNENDTNCVLTSMAITYTIPFPQV